MQSSEIREKYLDFFKSKGHKIVPSSSLIPEGDSTTLFTGSGMQPIMPYLLGAKHPLGSRVVDSQKCFRAEDIEEVGDNRHTTFFEMLGNWSFGDYWKAEQLPWLFEFLTKEVGIDPNKLHVTVFSGDPKNHIPKDEESPVIWQKLFTKAGVSPDERIYYYGSEKNWWSRAGTPEQMPIGEPGGPDSEIFYDFETPHDTKYGKECHPNCDCGRFLEIGNSVFMEYVKTEKGFEKLKQKNVDFGGGLERITAASNNDSDIFNIDLLKPIVLKIKELVPKADSRSERIIADHIRAAIFLIGDGVVPSNKLQGYFLRRLIRRAITYVRKSGLNSSVTKVVAENVAEIYGRNYPETNSEQIFEVLSNEELKFRTTLAKGLKILESKSEITGKEAFDLFQTYGFPFELTSELVKVTNPEEYKIYYAQHSESSTAASAGMFKGGLASHSDKIVRLHTATHLMNAALRKVLGGNVWQKGSNITEERTRFDFTHDKKMTDEEKKKVEELVNEWVKRNLTVKRETMLLKDARKLGAIGVFGEKYPDTVSVYTVFDPKTDEIISREFCGGPHVERTGMIGKFKIQKEEAVSAGVRRIKASIE